MIQIASPDQIMSVSKYHALTAQMVELSLIVESAKEKLAQIGREIMDQNLSEQAALGLTDHQVFCQVCETLGISPESVKRKDRTLKAVRNRSAAIEMLARAGWGTSRIARIVQRHPSAVSHLIDKGKE